MNQPFTIRSAPLVAVSAPAKEFPSANALRVVAVLEADERDQAGDPADWTEWTEPYKRYLAAKIDRAYRGF